MSTMDAELSDLIAAILFFGSNPSEPLEPWPVLASRIYAGAGVLLSPTEVEHFYFKNLLQFGGAVAAKSKVEEMVLNDVRSGKERFQRVCALIVPNFLSVCANVPAKILSAATTSVSATSSSSSILQGSDVVAGAAHVFGAIPTSSSSSKPSLSQAMTPDHLLDVIQLFRAVEGFDVFEEPVGPRVVNTVMSANNYAMVIKESMSISKIRSLVHDGQIASLQDLECAIWKIAANCVFFNVPEGRYPGLARRFAAACSVIIRREAGLQ